MNTKIVLIIFMALESKPKVIVDAGITLFPLFTYLDVIKRISTSKYIKNLKFWQNHIIYIKKERILESN